MTRVASKSKTMKSVGGRAPAAHASALAEALAALIAAIASASIESSTRHAVGSDATDPNRSGWSRSTLRSDRLVPPSATITARSTSTRPGSWAERRWRVGAMAADRPAVSPSASATSASNRLPAWAATPVPSEVTTRRGRRVLRFTMEVPFWSGVLRL